MMPVENQHPFTLYKFEHQEVLLKHSQTHKVYRYEEPTDSNVFHTHDDPMVITLLPLGPGFVYEKEETTLEKVLTLRSSMHHKQYFSEPEIANTFKNILEFIARGNHYGHFSPSAILIDHEGDIRLKHPTVIHEKQVAFHNDLQGVGFVILQAALLKPANELLPFVSCQKRIVNELTTAGYSVQFSTSIWILLSKVNPLLHCVLNQEKSETNQQFKMIVDQIKEIQKQKIAEDSKLDQPETLKKPKVHLQITPKKNPICIPPLNLRQRQPNQILNVQRKIDLSVKKRPSHNQNLNEQTKSMHKQKQDKSKILDVKIQTNQMKNKKNITNLVSSPQKRRGKTAEKKGQLKI